MNERLFASLQHDKVASYEFHGPVDQGLVQASLTSRKGYAQQCKAVVSQTSPSQTSTANPLDLRSRDPGRLDRITPYRLPPKVSTPTSTRAPDVFQGRHKVQAIPLLHLSRPDWNLRP